MDGIMGGNNVFLWRHLVSEDFKCSGDEASLFDCTNYGVFRDVPITSFYDTISIICGQKKTSNY